MCTRTPPPTHTTFKYGYLKKPAEGTRPGARVTGSCELFERDARNLTRVLWKNGEPAILMMERGRE